MKREELESYQRLILTRATRMFWALKKEGKEEIIKAINHLCEDVGMSEELKLNDLKRF